MILNNRITPYNPELHNAVSNHDFDKTLTLINQGADINGKEKEHGNTPLHTAAAYGSLSLSALLIFHGADIYAKNNQKNSVLHVAAINNRLEICQLFLNKGVNVNERDPSGKTALYYAAEKGYDKVCALLLNHGASLNAVSKEGCTPFETAVARGRETVCELFLDKGVDPNRIGKNRDTPLHIAAYWNQYDICELLLDQKVKVNAKNKYENTPLNLAAKNGHFLICELLLDNDADVNCKNIWKETPLHQVVYSGNSAACRLLLEKNPDVNAKNMHGNTPLHVSCIQNHAGITMSLIDKGAHFNVVNEGGYTPGVMAKIFGTIDHVSNDIVKSYNKEFLIRKLLGNVFGIERTSKITISGKVIEFELCGWFPQYFWKKIEKSILAFGVSFPYSFNYLKIRSACEDSGDLRRVVRWENHRPVVLHSGYKGHYFSLLVWDKHLVFLNRGGGVMPGKYGFFKTWAAFQFHGNLSAEIISQVEEQKDKSLSESKQFFTKELPKLLNYGPKDEFSIGVNIPIQMEGNCSWANTGVLILVMMIFDKCKSENVNPASSEKRKIVVSAINTYKNWLSFHELKLVKRYLKRCKKGDPYCDSDWNLLEKAIAAGGNKTGLDPVLRQQWDQIKVEFLSVRC